MDISKRVRAPIAGSERRKLKADLQNLRATAARKGTLLDAWDERIESRAGKEHFELGCWLYYYSQRIYTEGVESRIDCARRIFAEGITNPGYRFFTVFDFGERQFDTLFEMGDAEQVIEGLRRYLPGDETGGLKRAFENFGWPERCQESTKQFCLI